MESRYFGKIALLVLILIILFVINYKFNNIILRTYNNFTGISKTIVVFVSMLSIIAPTLVYDIPFFKSWSKPPQQRNEQSLFQQPPSKFRTKSVRNVSESVKKYVAANQYWKCKKCNNLLDETYEIDHIIALEDNGSNNLKNLQALCRNCHGKKTARNNIMKRFTDEII
jgi:hypothetical protein